MGKKAKEHRKRVAKRNERIRLEKKKIQNIQMEFLKKLIEQENQRGAFNSPVMPMPGFEAPILNTPMPGFEGPMVNTPMTGFEGPIVDMAMSNSEVGVQELVQEEVVDTTSTQEDTQS